MMNSSSSSSSLESLSIDAPKVIVKKSKCSNDNSTITLKSGTPKAKTTKQSKAMMEKLRKQREIEEIHEKYNKLASCPFKIDHLLTPDDMVNWAFCNRENIDNMLLLEWSEAVILQLCDLEKPLNFENMTWSQAKNIYLDNLWNIIIALPLRKASGTTRNLDYYMKKNHQYKIQTFGMPSEQMFLTRPSINYNLLKSFNIQIQSFDTALCKRLCMQKK